MSELHDLLTLQRNDTAADQLRHRRATLPELALVRGLEGELARLGSDLAAATADRQALETRQARLEADVEAAETKRHTIERRLASTSVPREAQTMSDEIDGFKARQSALEDELLEIMEVLEPVDERLVKDRSAQGELEERLTVARAALGAAETAVDRELADVLAARPAALASIPKAWLDRYEKLRAHLGGVAVATLDGPRCTGCNLMLPTRELEHVRAAAPEVIIECEQCGRILVR